MDGGSRQDEAERRLERRRASVPPLRYPPELPVTERREELLDTIRANQVVIVAGETGSGKSTQLPKLCLEAGRGLHGFIGHTQPRRLAARTVAERIAEELGSEVGGVVGYKVRFTDRVSNDSLVKVMTDGILLAEIQRDRLLRGYDTLIVDEAHERSLNIDFILGYLRELLPRRPDLKVIVTSATIDTERFSRHFDGAPIVEVSGRTYPVEMRYQPVVDDREDADRDPTQAMCDAIRELTREGPGDILVFLSGEREIRDAADAVRASFADRDEIDILPLYARLSAAEQHRVFQPHQRRRVVLATNVAETSLTVPGIRYVVDPGTARISRYNRRTKVQRLPIEAISQASANQRAGRCGRVAPGICIRLYGEDDFAARPEFTEPEILRTNLASVILQMAAIGLGDIESFPFVEPPDSRMVKDGIALLEELGALDPSKKDTPKWLTPLGRKLAQLPLDPRVGRMVIEAAKHACVREVMVIAAALSIQDPRERPVDAQEAAAEMHARFAHKDSDFLTYLAMWDYLRERQKALSSNQFRKLCRNEFLNYLRVREWQDIYSQLRQVGTTIGIHVDRTPGDVDAIHISLLSGLLSHIGMRNERDDAKQEYQGARNARFAITRGSALYKKSPRWVMAAELVETNRLWARVVSRIQPEWAERVGAHLVKRTYGEPEWDARRGQVVAHERVTLYGLPIVAARRVDYTRVDAAVAREMFIRHALVEGDWQTHHAFVAENEEVIEQVRALEDRVRRRDILVGDDALAAWFDARVPADITSARRFDQWWKTERHREPDLLTLTPEDVTDPAAAGFSAADFPDVWHHGELALEVSYELDPSSPTDGVTVHVPLDVLNQVTPAGFDWQVPGLREELVTALIRSLPKAYRRNFVPAPDHARAFLASATPADGRLLDVLADRLGRMTGDAIPPESWQLDRVPPHLRATFSITAEDGREFAVGKDLDALKRKLQPRVRAAIADAVPDIERTGATAWSFGTIPRAVETVRGGRAVRGYPALVDEGATVGVRVLPTADDQERAMWAGTRRLLTLTMPSPVKAVQSSLTNEAKLALAFAPHASPAELFDDCVAAAIDRLIADHGGPAWDDEAFAKLRDHVRGDVVPAAAEIGAIAGRILVAVRSVETRLDRLTAPAFVAATMDVRTQLPRLVPPGFATRFGARRLPDVLRYVEAIDRRLDKLPQNPARDTELLRKVQRLDDEYRSVVAALPPERLGGSDVDGPRWMLEELRVSFFAQTLRTAYPVSEERIRRALASLAGGG
ncbi:MAG TPA: ATP-dependent RNA helicase HrpA [Acidimicrobiales bacterium]